MSRRERQRRRRRNQGPARIVFLGFGVVSAAAAIAVLGLVGWVVSVATSGPSIDALKPVNPGSSSVVYAADGSRLGFIQSDVLRTPISSSDIPQNLKDATIAIEDKRFFKHKGVDFEGLVRSGFKNITTGNTVQGGSTLTMQLVRNLYTDDRVRTGIAGYKRKIREAKLAEELENIHSKDWILNKYVNNVPYGTVGGQEAIGVQAAARVFFNKPAKDLKLHEAALLAGLPQAPSQYNPFLDEDAAMRRRNEVLRAMADQGYIQPQTATRAIAKPLGVKSSGYYTERRENFFFDFVRSELIKKYGANEVRKGGLKIYTTIDLKLQQAARTAMANVLNQPGDPASAIVTIDPRNGYIRAMASSASYGQSKFNLAAQGHRQPGSTFKTMVLMTALRRGVNPNTTTYVSKQLKFDDPKWGPIDVQTYSHSYIGRANLVKATLTSDNSIYEQLDLDLGPDQVKQTARDLGIKSPLEGLPAEGLGGLKIGVSPLEMANAYATIASGGWRNRPIAITKVVFPDGHSEDLGKPRRHRAFEDGVTYEATKILEQNVQAGTGTAANIGCPAAGKTGTTDSFRDAWFAGFTPRLSTAVWVGYPNTQVEMRSVHGISVAGGTFPAQIWSQYMKVAKGGYCGSFPQPNHPFQSSPFFGKYATTGVQGNQADESSVPDPAAAQSLETGGASGPKNDAGGTNGTGGGGGGTTGGGTTGGGGGAPNNGGGNGAGNGGGNGAGKGNGGWDPNAYESPPQAPATPPAAPPATSAGGAAAPGRR